MFTILIMKFSLWNYKFIPVAVVEFAGQNLLTSHTILILYNLLKLIIVSN